MNFNLNLQWNLKIHCSDEILVVLLHKIEEKVTGQLAVDLLHSCISYLKHIHFYNDNNLDIQV